jgi:hypothetical protein
MNPLLVRLLPYLLGTVGIVSAGWWIHHRGYAAGQAERTAHYQPLLAQIDLERAKAEERVKAAQAASDVITAQVEQRHAQTEQALQTRANAAERRITGLLSQLTASGRRDEVHDPAGAPALAGPAPEERERIDRASRRLASIAAGCESDAANLNALQAFYDAQRRLQSGQ